MKIKTPGTSDNQLKYQAVHAKDLCPLIQYLHTIYFLPTFNCHPAFRAHTRFVHIHEAVSGCAGYA